VQRLKGWLAAEKPQSEPLGVMLLNSKLAILAPATLVGSNSMNRIALAYLYSALAPTLGLDSHSP
jgi:hypothetical protein